MPHRHSWQWGAHRRHNFLQQALAEIRGHAHCRPSRKQFLQHRNPRRGGAGSAGARGRRRGRCVLCNIEAFAFHFCYPLGLGLGRGHEPRHEEQGSQEQGNAHSARLHRGSHGGGLVPPLRHFPRPGHRLRNVHRGGGLVYVMPCSAGPQHTAIPGVQRGLHGHHSWHDADLFARCAFEHLPPRAESAQGERGHQGVLHGQQQERRPRKFFSAWIALPSKCSRC
mmetsp:Transcript_8161/g.23245  ORF Transcript_8161/g.23245 Transcript_8161/m.23245 type:complete len:224 (+) Transcript_8161:135-806(+)